MTLLYQETTRDRAVDNTEKSQKQGANTHMDNSLIPKFVASSVWLWESFGKELVAGTYSAIKDSARKRWLLVEWKHASKRYQERMYKLYSTMRILGLANPAPVEGLFTDLYILNKITAFRRYDIEMLSQETNDIEFAQSSRVRTNAVELAKQSDNLFILGRPGAGKTTLLKYLTLQAITGSINKIPIFISLNDWASSNLSLMSYIEKQFDICDFPDAKTFIENVLLKMGRAIVLFDGLDEVSEQNNQRNRITQQIQDFTNKYSSLTDSKKDKEIVLARDKNRSNTYAQSENKFIVTCRIASTDYLLAKFPYVELADFTEEQVASYAKKWFVSNAPKARGFVAELSKSEHKGLREIANTPVLLNLLCIAYDEGLGFPPRRAEIYQEAIDTLLKKWDSSRNIKRDEIYRGLSYIRKQQMLSKIAVEYYQSGKIYFKEEELSSKIGKFLKSLPSTEVDDEPDATAVLKAIESQHSLLVERAYKIYSFSHLTFQEYFTARYIVENSVSGTIPRLMQFLEDDRWYEVVRITASLISDSTYFFASFEKALNRFAQKSNLLGVLNLANKNNLKYFHSLPPVYMRNAILCLISVDPLTASGLHPILGEFNNTFILPNDFAVSAKGLSKQDPDFWLDYCLLNCLALALYIASEEKRTNSAPHINYYSELGKLIQETAKLASELDLKLLKMQLQELPLPKIKATVGITKNIVVTLNKVVKGRLGNEIFSFFKVTNKEAIKKYLKMNKLLIEALNVAAHPKREGIIRDLLIYREHTFLPSEN